MFIEYDRVPSSRQGIRLARLQPIFMGGYLSSQPGDGLFLWDEALSGNGTHSL